MRKAIVRKPERVDESHLIPKSELEKCTPEQRADLIVNSQKIMLEKLYKQMLDKGFIMLDQSENEIGLFLFADAMLCKLSPMTNEEAARWLKD